MTEKRPMTDSEAAKLGSAAEVQQASHEPDPDEAKLEAIAKRLLSTPPDRHTVAPKRKADKAKGS